MPQTTQRDGRTRNLEELMRGLRKASAEAERTELERQIYDAAAERLIRDLTQRFPGLERPDAEEIVSDALLNLLRDPARYDPSRAGLLTYLAMVVRRDAQNLLRKRERQPSRIPLSLVGSEQGQGAAEAHSIRPLLIARVEAVVERLPSVTRQTMRLALAGMTISEIARELGCSPGTVRTRKSRGVRMIRERLADAEAK